MQDRILALLGIAARAGKIVSGGFSAEEAVRSRIQEKTRKRVIIS